MITLKEMKRLLKAFTLQLEFNTDPWEAITAITRQTGDTTPQRKAFRKSVIYYYGLPGRKHCMVVGGPSKDVLTAHI